MRAIAGLWRTGSGTVQHPPMEDVFFLPQRPYMPTGTLRSQTLYPTKDTELTDERLLELLQEMQLESLAERVGGLDPGHDWEKPLSMGEQQRLSFARVLACAPRIVIVRIAHRPAVLKHHTHVLELKGEGARQVHAAGDCSFDH